jgi:hypothetical protein
VNLPPPATSKQQAPTFVPFVSFVAIYVYVEGSKEMP